MIRLIKERQFEKAYELIGGKFNQERFDLLVNEAYKTDDIVFYDFLNYIIENHDECAEYHYYCSEIMCVVYNIRPEGYKTGFSHAKKASELDPNNISFKEHILLYNQIPDKLLSDDLAMQIATEVIKIDPDNEVAKLCLTNKSK